MQSCTQKQSIDLIFSQLCVILLSRRWSQNNKDILDENSKGKAEIEENEESCKKAFRSRKYQIIADRTISGRHYSSIATRIQNSVDNDDFEVDAMHLFFPILIVLQLVHITVGWMFFDCGHSNAFEEEKMHLILH